MLRAKASFDYYESLLRPRVVNLKLNIRAIMAHLVIQSVSIYIVKEISRYIWSTTTCTRALIFPLEFRDSQVPRLHDGFSRINKKIKG